MQKAKTFSRVIFGLAFVAAGINHFLHTALYVGIMPAYLPQPRALVLVSGVAEVALGVALLARGVVSHWAAWGLIALLIAVFPANVNMAFHGERFPMVAPALLWIRLPLQGVLIVWAYWYTREERCNEVRSV